MYSDEHRQPLQSIKILFVGQDVTKYVLFAETTFDSVGGAQPGTCRITLRGDPAVTALLETGSSIKLIIDGKTYWQGYSSMITRSYFFADKTVPKVVIEGVDLNILFDRLIIYNHLDPRLWPTGGEKYIPSKTHLKTPGEIPNPTPDREFLINSLKDTDLNLITPRIGTNLISEVGAITSTDDPTLTGSTMSAGATIRALFENATNVVTADRGGSIIYYISPEAQFIYSDIDWMDAPFSVSDDGSTDVACREMEIVRDASHLKNDVLVFAGELKPGEFVNGKFIPSREKLFRYSHRKAESSISRYGRFQYSETQPAWSSTLINARSRKIIDQENTPGLRVGFTIFRAGLYPGSTLNISAGTFGLLEKVPVRAVHTSFDTQYLARHTVTCSYDTNDPWGILLAMKRPAQRGLIQPRNAFIELQPGDDPPHVDYYTSIEEVPKGLGGGWYQCSYKYIRGSLIVYINGSKGSRIYPPGDNLHPGESTVTDYQEMDPNKGKFHCTASGKLWVAYHVAGNL